MDNYVSNRLMLNCVGSNIWHTLNHTTSFLHCFSTGRYPARISENRHLGLHRCPRSALFNVASTCVTCDIRLHSPVFSSMTMHSSQFVAPACQQVCSSSVVLPVCQQLWPLYFASVLAGVTQPLLFMQMCFIAATFQLQY